MAILVTGASRGIGAQTARQLAADGEHVVINYREKRKRAEKLAEEIVAAGGSASVLGADLTDPAAVARMATELADDGLTGLVLNASGGLEQGADDDYPMRINRDAQVSVLDALEPLLRAGSRVVFVTSHQAHFVGDREVPSGYLPIARSKRAGEDAIRARQGDLAVRGIGLSVVSGDMIDGTIIVRLLERRDADAVDSRRAAAPLPTVEEFATAVAEEVLRTDTTARTVFVGGADYLAS